MYFLQLATTKSSDYTVIISVSLVLSISFFVYQYQQRRRRKRQERESATIFSSIQSSSSTKSTIATSQEDESEEITDPLERIADALGESIWKIKVALGIPLTATCTASTAREAERAFDEAGSDSEDEIVAFLRWVELENDINRMEGMYDSVEGWPYLVTPLLAKWNKLAMNELNAISNDDEDELVDMYSRTPDSTESDFEVIRRLHKLYTK